jgi:tetratricopeptide (TPR) repeat protein
VEPCSSGQAIQCIEADLEAFAEALASGDHGARVAAGRRAYARLPDPLLDTVQTFLSLSWRFLTPSQAAQVASAAEGRSGSGPGAISLASEARSLRRILSGRFTPPETTGSVRRWTFVGGFESPRGAGLGRVDPTQTRFDPTERVVTSRGLRAWRTAEIPSQRRHFVALDWTYPTRSHCLHLVTAVELSAAGRLALHGGDERRVWVDGKPFVELRGLDGSLRRTLILPEPIAAGAHQIEVRDCPRSGSGALAMSFVAADGSPLPIRQLDPQRRERPLSSSFTPFDLNAHLDAEIPANWPARLRAFALATNLALSGRKSAALAALQGIAESDRLGQILVRRVAGFTGRNEQGLAAAERLAERHGLPSELVDHLLRLGQDDRAAKEYFARKIEVHTLRDADLLAKVLAASAPVAERLRHWTAMVERWPEWQLAKVRLSQRLRAAGRVREADRWVSGWRRTWPGDNTLTRLERERAGERQDVAALRRLAAEKLRRDPVDLGAQRRLADLDRFEGRLDAARKRIERALLQNPYSPQLNHWLTRQNWEQGGASEARDALDKTLAVKPDHRGAKTAQRFIALREGRSLKVANWHRPTEAEIEALIAGRAAHHPRTAVGRVLLLDDHLDFIEEDGSRRSVTTIVSWFLNRQTAQMNLKTNLRGLAQLQIHQAFLVRPDGERVAPASIRGGSIRFREISAGSVLVLQYESLSSPNKLLPGLVSGGFWFEGSDTTAVTSRYTLASALEGRTPIFNVVGPEVSVLSGEFEGVRSWQYTREDVPPAVLETQVIAGWRSRSQVRYTTMKSWDAYVAWVRDLFREAGRLTPAVQAKAAALAGEAPSPEAAIAAIYRFAVKDIQYEQDYARVIEGWEPHLPDQVLERGYGDCKDKTMLIVAMLKARKIAAYPALIRTQRLGAVDRALPSNQFNHAVVWLPEQAGVSPGRFLDATAEYLDLDNLRLDVQATDALILDDAGWRFQPVPVRAAEQESVNHQLRHLGGRRWSITSTFRGRDGERVRRGASGDKSAVIIRALVAMSTWDGSTLIDHQIIDEPGQRLVLKAQFDAPFSLTPGRPFNPPKLMGAVWGKAFAQPSRRAPLLMLGTRTIKVSVSSTAGSLSADDQVRRVDTPAYRASMSCSGGVCRQTERIDPMVIEPGPFAPIAEAVGRFHRVIQSMKLVLNPGA